MAKVNYNGTTNAGASKEIAAENNARKTFYFNNPSASDMVLNFGAAAAAATILTVKAGNSIYLTAAEPFEIKKSINVFSAAAVAYEAQVEQ